MHRYILTCSALLAAAAVATALGAPRARDGGFDVRPVVVPAEDSKAVVRGNTAFALDVYDRLRATPGNLVFSPISLSTALAMATEGAAGKTRREMASVLHLGLPRARFGRAYQSVLSELAPAPGGGVEIGVANAVFADIATRFRPAFRRAVERHYGALARSADFEADPSGAVRAINAWGAEHTQGLIPSILGVGDLPGRDGFVLADAAYFSGKWAQPFTNVSDEPFWFAEGGVMAPLMREEGVYAWAEDDDLLTVEIPYVGGEASMVVLMPRDAAGLAAFEASLTPAALARSVRAMREEQIVLHFPSFEVESLMDLNAPLESLGMERAFDPKRADFSRATTRRTVIGRVGQSATVRVDSEGTVAAAVTYTTFFVATAAQGSGPPPDVRVDRPFLFLIRHGRTGTILFMGRVEDPTALPR